jgi:hypothetical protein
MRPLSAASPLSRRSALKLGAAFTGRLLAAASLPAAASVQAQDRDPGPDTAPSSQARQTIEQILQAKGKLSDGVLSISIVRKDIQGARLHGVPIPPGFLIHGGLDFQAAAAGRDEVMMNADMCLKSSELDPFIHHLIESNIAFQAEHQHFYDFEPLLWFVHFRARGDAATIARGVKSALSVTSAPFPQAPASHPQTPLPADRIGRILGAPPQVKEGGIVLYQLPRRESIRLGGMVINPNLNVETHVHFMPHGGGQNAAAAPDFGMIASEIDKVIGRQQKNGWDIGCLYNQETDEHPQLFWSHNFKTGDSLQLAHELREAFDLMNLKFK